MAVRLPGLPALRPDPESGYNVLQHEMLQEKAASLGRAGDRAVEALRALRACDRTERDARLQAAAVVVHQWFVQREICGLRRHDDVIRELEIPREVLARLGAAHTSPKTR